MGFMTEMSLLNDDWHNIASRIEADPKSFTNFVQRAMNGEPMYGPADENGKRKFIGRSEIGWYGYLCVHSSHHADEEQIYTAGRNTMTRVDPGAAYALVRAVKTEEPNPFRQFSRVATEEDLDHMEEDIDRTMQSLKLAKKYIADHRKSVV
jgi:hypothetical protein